MNKLVFPSLLLVITIFGNACKSSIKDEANPKSSDTIPVSNIVAKPFTVVESSYVIVESFSGNYLKWSAVIENPNDGFYGIFPTLSITARNEEGEVVGTEDQVLQEFPPGKTLAWAGQISVSEKPTKVEIAALKVDWRTTKTNPKDYLNFDAEKVKLTKEYNSYRITGDIKNPYNKDIEQLAVVGLLRDKDGKLLGGSTSFVESIPSNGSRPFSISFIAVDTIPEKTEIFAFPWGAITEWNRLASQMHK